MRSMRMMRFSTSVIGICGNNTIVCRMLGEVCKPKISRSKTSKDPGNPRVLRNVNNQFI